MSAEAGIDTLSPLIVQVEDDILFWEAISEETRYQMSDNILVDINDPLNISNCEEDEVEGDEIDMCGTWWD